MDEKIDIIVCASCGVVNQVSSSSCVACGSILGAEKNFIPPPSATTKPAKTEVLRIPRWLKAIVGIFIVYAVVMVVYEGMNLPSGSVQRGEQSIPQAQTETQTQTDPAIVNQIKDLEKQVAANPNNAEIVLQFANTLHDAKFYPRAIEMYKKYVKLNPSNNDARVDLGICYFEIGNLEQSVKEIESVIKKDPKHQMAMFNLGIIQLSSQNLVEAKKWFKQCIAIDPQSTAGLRAQQILEQH